MDLCFSPKDEAFYMEVREFFEKETSASVIISADQCFGACDIVNSELKEMNIDFVIQIGHTQIPNIEDYHIPTLFVNAKSDIDISKVIKKAVHVINGKKIGLITTSQHIDALENTIKILKENNVSRGLSGATF